MLEIKETMLLFHRKGPLRLHFLNKTQKLLIVYKFLLFVFINFYSVKRSTINLNAHSTIFAYHRHVLKFQGLPVLRISYLLLIRPTNFVGFRSRAPIERQVKTFPINVISRCFSLISTAKTLHFSHETV